MRKPAGLVSWGLGACVCALGLAGALVGGARAQDRNETPWLGVYTQEMTSSLRDAMDFRGDGVLVNRVVSGSPAERAGVEKGDVIVSVNSRTVHTPDELSSVVRGARVGQSVSLVVVRNGERHTLEARLAGRDSGEETRDLESEEFDVPVPPSPPAIRKGRVDVMPAPEPDVLYRGMGRGRLGVRVETLNADLGDYFGVKDGKGALVVEVLPDTPADRIGLKAGDVITGVGDRTVADAEALIRALNDADGKVSLRVIRKGARRTFETELDAAPARRRAMGRESLGFSDRERIRVLRPEGPDGRMLREELRELREELRELRERLDRMDRN
ncbi:MAG TPA: PDZ domain-containing protein [Candidatus Limnocylindria bacterium]|nr:PDZ domain-containing protein [Candidatus Limnocylindria bacterium]